MSDLIKKLRKTELLVHDPQTVLQRFEDFKTLRDVYDETFPKYYMPGGPPEKVYEVKNLKVIVNGKCVIGEDSDKS